MSLDYSGCGVCPPWWRFAAFWPALALVAGCSSSVPGGAVPMGPDASTVDAGVDPCEVLRECCASEDLEAWPCRQGPDGMNAVECAEWVRELGEQGSCGVGEGPAIAEFCNSGGAEVVRELDLLFVIDTSPGMEEAQRRLFAEIPEAVRILGTGDLDGDGLPESESVQELHVGVVTTDMGVGDVGVEGCSEFGGDGRVVADAACGSSAEQSFLAFDPSSPMGGLEQLQCLADVGTEGCRFSQPLEATLKALAPSTSGYDFYADTLGHGDTVHAGFVREGAVLAVILLTNREDCSARNRELFDPSSDRYRSELSRRCFEHRHDTHAVHPIERYIDGLLTTQDPRNIIFEVIAGVPLGISPGVRCDASSRCPRGTMCDGQRCVAPSGDLRNFDSILVHPDMAERLDVAEPSRLMPACSSGDLRAEPARRIVEVARGVASGGASAAVTSICLPDYGGVFERLYPAVFGDGRCFFGLGPQSFCRLTERTVDDCSALPGRRLIGRGPDGYYLCEIERLPYVPGQGEPSGVGWYLQGPGDEHSCGDAHRVAFSEGFFGGSHGVFSLSCLPHSDAPIVGTDCSTDAALCATGEIEGLPLACDEFTRTCQLPCRHALECLPGQHCVEDEGSEFFGYCSEFYEVCGR